MDNSSILIVQHSERIEILNKEHLAQFYISFFRKRDKFLIKEPTTKFMLCQIRSRTYIKCASFTQLLNSSKKQENEK